MPKYRLDPPISGIFVPEVGAFNADADGIFELPAVAAVEKALAEMGVTATEVAEEAQPPAPSDDGEPPIDGAEGSAPKPRAKTKAGA